MNDALSDTLREQLQNRIDNKTKPPGSLGDLESLAVQIGLIQNTASPNVDQPAAFIFGADHGVCAEGVNPFPQVVTEQMLANFAAGGAAMSVFCRTNNIPLTIVNMGIVNTAARWPEVMHCAVAAGTQNFRHGPAMTTEQCDQAITCGKQIAVQAVRDGHNLLLIGEMGIGNTSSASAILSALANRTAAECVGLGTGINSEQLERKKAVVEQGVARCKGLELKEVKELADLTDIKGLKDIKEVLAQVGGYEIVQMVGGFLGAYQNRTPILVDGFIVSVAAYVATLIEPNCRDYMIFAHRSEESGHKILLELLDAEPLLDLGLRLGEGTGAALAMPIIRAAAEFYNNMASFESAGVTV